MKKNFLLAALLALAMAASWFVFKKIKHPSTLNKDERDFAVKDTSSIYKIIISDKNKNKSELERTDSGWVVNKKYFIRSDAYYNLMEAIKRVEVFYPVPQSQRDLVLRSMSHSAIKVEIFNKRRCIKKYYIGAETPDGQGTYMLLSYENEENKNYENPFVTGIPGFVGFLSPRYITKENFWRTTEVFSSGPHEILKIQMINHEFPDSSFTIEQTGKQEYTLRDHHTHPVTYTPFRLKQYLAYYTTFSIELYFSEIDKKISDSLISKGTPFRTIVIETAKGKKEEFLCYRRPVEANKDEEFKAMFKYDPDRFYLRKKVPGGNDIFAYAQYFVFGKLFVNYDYFQTP
ncbi:MAG: hypothetical protein N3F09_03085 [Bacteroidia bacterium]|nr:hypothetical protein [Bacteroidia bacterium]